MRGFSDRCAGNKIFAGALWLRRAPQEGLPLRNARRHRRNVHTMPTGRASSGSLGNRCAHVGRARAMCRSDDGKARYAEIEQPRLWRKDVLPTDRGGRPLVRSHCASSSVFWKRWSSVPCRARRIPALAAALYAERIFDADAWRIARWQGRHRAGLAAAGARRPKLTVRHVDLKAWMSRFYPGDRPGFCLTASNARCIRR